VTIDTFDGVNGFSSLEADLEDQPSMVSEAPTIIVSLVQYREKHQASQRSHVPHIARLLSLPSKKFVLEIDYQHGTLMAFSPPCA